jgi:hypothetical protein
VTLLVDVCKAVVNAESEGKLHNQQAGGVVHGKDLKIISAMTKKKNRSRTVEMEPARRDLGVSSFLSVLG